MMQFIYKRFAGEFGINFFRFYLPRSKLVNPTAQMMWQTDFGQRSSRRLAFGTCSLIENTTLQLAVATFCVFKRISLPDVENFDLTVGPVDTAIEALAESFREGFENERLIQSDFFPIGQIILVGNSYIGGWNQIEMHKKLTLEEKATLGYCLGFELERQKQPRDAKRAFEMALKSSCAEIVSIAQEKLKAYPTGSRDKDK